MHFVRAALVAALLIVVGCRSTAEIFTPAPNSPASPAAEAAELPTVGAGLSLDTSPDSDKESAPRDASMHQHMGHGSVPTRPTANGGGHEH